ncbi:MAG: NAD-dependent epimerase/dehydratase family protein [Candidatus Omnitrophica bacterium]|nr:NAD-dependent epimerase/dehydratase family protein [Candidatus Omnitrophota bacterium]
MKKSTHNSHCTCWNCPAINLAGKVDFRACGQTVEKFGIDGTGAQIMAECKRRPELGLFDPTAITFKECAEWQLTPCGYLLKDMRIMILGIDGYLGWPLALWLGKLGCKVSGVDNYSRRDWVKERGAHTIVPIARMTERLHAAKEVLGIDINFREMDILNRNRLKEFIDEVKPEAIVHYAECPSAPYSMIDFEHAKSVQSNNVIGTLATLFSIHEVVPETSLIKLGTMGEYGMPLTGRPLFEGFFPADAVLKWEGREWSMGGELTPRDPVSFYHVSKVQDTFNVYEACKYWWLRSYDVMQGVIYGVHTDHVAADPRLRTRFDIDECFGTIINRFVAQAVIGFPLTLYGAGEQIRGFISLEDAMQCITRLIAKPPEPGQYSVVNQMSGYCNLRKLAETVAKVGKEEFNIDVKIQRVENPRVESERHPFEPIFNKLPDEFGFQQNENLEQEIRKMFALLMQPHIKSRIEEKKHLILPRTWWSGVKKEVEQIELIENAADRDKREHIHVASTEVNDE